MAFTESRIVYPKMDFESTLSGFRFFPEIAEMNASTSTPPGNSSMAMMQSSLKSGLYLEITGEPFCMSSSMKASTIFFTTLTPGDLRLPDS